MNEKPTSALPAAIAGLAIGVGAALGGWFIGRGFYAWHMSDRYVTVRGLVERNVKADLAVWILAFTATGDDVGKVNQEIEHDNQIVLDFVKARGFSSDEIEPIATRVSDMLANPYRGNNQGGPRYIIRAGLMIRSLKIDLVRQASQMTGDLIKQGIVLGQGTGDSDSAVNPSYVFTKLDSIRPSMLADATKSARAVAEQFARDSNSALGPIRHANQGVFQIASRDDQSSGGGEGGWSDSAKEQASIDKKVRLVSTVEYYLVGE
ncbi:MAG TPA: SIMPL domain-containing protein [Candidatus Binataceae bacterium]|nr:SIMPL domain-containing protein [Candidatus Binataceae bacterium]